MDPNSLQAMVLGLVARHALTALAATLVTLGWIGSGDQSNFVTIGTGIVMGASAIAWSWWQKTGHAQVLATLNRIRGGGNDPQIARDPGSPH